MIYSLVLFKTYLILLILAALISYCFPKEETSAIISLVIFLVTICILIYLKISKPDDLWYNGRAVAESIKTRSWRWCMRASPYENNIDLNIIMNQFIADQKNILKQNKNVSSILDEGIPVDPISDTMKQIRSLSISDRLAIYKEQRIKDQINWYSLNSQKNKRKSNFWFVISIILHVIAISLLSYKIKELGASLPIETFTTAAAAVLTWINSKKYNELHSSYKLTAHEITFIKMDGQDISTEDELSEFIINSETAFSREHTQWAARKIS